tara:strand:- start:3008 stop:3469 length:462 start_codon:yes stop_codon:yes gene_type:complete
MGKHDPANSAEQAIEKVIYGISIFFADSAYEMVKELDQQIVVIMIAVVFACLMNWFKGMVKIHHENLESSEIRTVGVWWQIMTRWLETFTMISAFIAIQGLVRLVMLTIQQNERFVYQAIIYPVLTIMIAIAMITVGHAHISPPGEAVGKDSQ